MSSWDKTRNNYINWLSQNKLKDIFLKDLKYKGFSLWWATKLVDRDNINDDSWYYNLHYVLNKKKITRNNINYFKLIFKLFKKFVKSLIFNLYVKIFFKKDTNIKEIENCFFSFGIDLVTHKKYFIDRQYGKISFKNRKKNAYLISLNEDLFFIKKIITFKNNLKKTPCKYFFLDHYISFAEIIKIYFFTLVKFFQVFSLLNKKSYYNIVGKNCSYPLKKELVDSFFGGIQNSLINGISTGNFLKNFHCKNFISYLEFYPLARCIYYFAKINNKKTNLISINHANYSSDNLFFNIRKNEFTGKNLNMKSPRPDIFFCQGEKYSKILKKIFGRKTVHVVGSLKIELSPYAKSKNIIKPFETRNISKNKKIITVFTSLNDYKSFVKILNDQNLSNYVVLLKPHPLKISKTFDYFRKHLKHEFIIPKKIEGRDLLNFSNFIIFGDTSIGLEAAIKNKNVFRIFHRDFIPTFNRDKEIPTATNSKEFTTLIKKKKILQKSAKIEKDYFFKYDVLASKRFLNYLRKV